MHKFLRRVIHFNQERLDSWVAQRAGAVHVGARVLDVGAGGAPYRALFSHCVYQTHDFGQLSREQIIQGNYAAIDYVSDITDIPVADGAFDVVVNTEVLEHVPRPIDALKEIARVLAPGGRLILTVPLGSGLHQEPYHFYGGYTPFFFRKFLSDFGFSQIEILPRGGSFAHLAQWLLWYAKRASPLALDMGVFKRVALFPLYLVQLPFLVLMFGYCRLVDGHDERSQFTGGYLVSAVKNAAPS